MEQVGINWALLAAQLINLISLALWIVLALVALRRLRRAVVSDLTRALWAALIVLVPLLGALAFFIAGPQAHRPDQRSSSENS